MEPGDSAEVFRISYRLIHNDGPAGNQLLFPVGEPYVIHSFGEAFIPEFPA